MVEVTDEDTFPGQSALAKILCGNLVSNGSEIDEVLEHLSNSIDNAVEELIALKSLSPKKVALFGPFLGRSILELGCTALIARLDPFRLIVLRERQKQPDFEIDKPNKSSIRWQGDVLAEKVKDLWDDKSLQNPTRALLGDYYTSLIWHKSFDLFLDSVEDVSGDEWISDLRRKDARRLCAELQRDFSSLYSQLSKGVHHELVIPSSSAFDRDTARDLIWRTIYNVSTLGLIVSVVSYAVNKLDIETAVEAYKEIQEMEILK